MATCPNCKAALPWNAPRCAACPAVFDHDRNWRPLPVNDEERVSLEVQEREEMLAGKRVSVGGFTVSLPKAGGIRLQPQGSAQGGCFWVLMGIAFLLIALVMAAIDAFWMMGLIVVPPLLTLGWMLFNRGKNHGAPGLYVYPEVGYLVSRSWWGDKTTELGVPLRLELRPFTGEEQDALGKGRPSPTQQFTSGGPLSYLLMVAGPAQAAHLAMGAEEEMLALQLELRDCMLRLAHREASV